LQSSSVFRPRGYSRIDGDCGARRALIHAAVEASAPEGSAGVGLR
jgi:hypothetical protein